MALMILAGPIMVGGTRLVDIVRVAGIIFSVAMTIYMARKRARERREREKSGRS